LNATLRERRVRVEHLLEREAIDTGANVAASASSKTSISSVMLPQYVVAKETS
jgi:hypothetical protein